jgi:hypothetical protein
VPGSDSSNRSRGLVHMRLSARLVIGVCAVWMFLVVAVLTIGKYTNPMLETPVARAMTGMIWGVVPIWGRWRPVVDIPTRKQCWEYGRQDSARSKISLLPLRGGLVVGRGGRDGWNDEPGACVGGWDWIGVHYRLGRLSGSDRVSQRDLVPAHVSRLGMAPDQIQFFQPNTVLLLYGLTGVLGASGTFGLQNLLAGGFWVLVYGLMVYPQPTASPLPSRGGHVSLSTC